MTIISKNKILCSIGDGFLSYKRGVFYYNNNIDNKSKFSFKLKTRKKFLSYFRLTERLLRLEPRTAISIDASKAIISVSGCVYSINVVSKKVELEHKYRTGVNNPLSFTKTPNGEILYGEYFTKRSECGCRIFKRNSDGKWLSIYEFKPHQIAHIHNIIYDKYRNCYWILTGDFDSESGIWKANLDFSSVEPFLVGSQTYRSCFLMPEENGFSFVTDTPLEINKLFFVKIENGDFKDITYIKEISGPCIYGRILENGNFVFATSVEPDPTLNKFRYRITNKLGRGIKDRFCHIYFGNAKTDFKEILKFKKDCLPIWLFQFGNMQFPEIDNGNIYMTGQSLCKIDGRTLVIDYDK